MNRAIGIDLGTSNSAGAVCIGTGQPIMVESKYGRANPYVKNFPSFVQFDYNGKVTSVGIKAKEALASNPQLVIWGVKRFVGLSYKEAQQREEFKRFKYATDKGGPDGSVIIKVGEERFTPSDILSFILKEIKEDASNTKINPDIAGDFDRAVISVPAYFMGTRVPFIEDAAKLAGFTDAQIIAEPTAAALAYLQKVGASWEKGPSKKDGSNLLTFDMGAGTLDITVMLVLSDLQPGEIATSGNNFLGGINMDDMIAQYVINKGKLNDFKDDPLFIQNLRKEVENAKILLSDNPELPNTFISITAKKGERPKSIPLSQKELEDAVQPILESCRGPIRTALQSSYTAVENLDHVLFVGGPTNMPCVRKLVRDELEKLGAKKQLLDELEAMEHTESPINPMECVAQGAALKAGGISQPLFENSPYGYGTRFGSRYYSIVPSSSNFPNSFTGSIIHHNPSALRVSIPLVCQIPEEDDKNKYRDLGNYDISIQPTGESPEFDITIELNDKREVITTLFHKQSGQYTSYEKLNLLEGTEVPLHDKEPTVVKSSTGSAGGGSGGGSGSSGGGGGKCIVPNRTREQLERAIHMARALLDLAESIPEVKNSAKALSVTIEESRDPDKDLPSIFNKLRPLLLNLRNNKVIKVSEYEEYLKKTRELEDS